jgi:hypothetical protein
MGAFCTNVEFNHVAREWRAKWSEERDKASLAAAQALLTEVIADLKKTDGVVSVQRIICGGCHDFKVIVKLAADKFGKFEEGGFGGEKAFLEKLGKVPGITHVETQTYTIEEM